MPYVLQARSGPGNLWVMRDHPGQPEYGDHLDANGQSLYGLIADGHVEHLDFTPRFTRSNSGKLGDLLWTTGDMAKLASRRFVEVLKAVDALEAAGVTELSVKRVAS